MNPHPTHLDDESGDLGPPVLELVQLTEEPVSPGLVARVRNSIGRRLFAADALDFSMPVVVKVFFEYLTAVFAAFGGDSGKTRRN